MKILVLGGYGLIGLSITKALIAAGHEVTGLGRSVRKGEAAAPQATWIGRDLSHMTEAEDWTHVLVGMEVVVNAAGVLQDGLNDHVMAVQRDAVKALAAACTPAGVRQIIQISAPGVSESSDTVFYRSKAEGDCRREGERRELGDLSPRPRSVKPQAYGGTSLLRQLAAVPLVQPVMLADADIRTVHVDDVAAAALFGPIWKNRAVEHVDADLLSSEPTRLEDLILSIRSWLGFAPPEDRDPCALAFLGALTARMGDLAGWLGWRPALADDLPDRWVWGRGSRPAMPQVNGRCETCGYAVGNCRPPCRSGAYARTALLYPILLLILSAFWVVSGVDNGWVQQSAAMAVFGPDMPCRNDGKSAGNAWRHAVALILPSERHGATAIRPLTRTGCACGCAASASLILLERDTSRRTSGPIRSGRW